MLKQLPTHLFARCHEISCFFFGWRPLGLLDTVSCHSAFEDYILLPIIVQFGHEVFTHEFGSTFLFRSIPKIRYPLCLHTRSTIAESIILRVFVGMSMLPKLLYLNRNLSTFIIIRLFIYLPGVPEKNYRLSWRKPSRTFFRDILYRRNN